MEVTVSIPQKKLTKKICVVEKETISSVMTNLGFDLDTIVVLHNNLPIPETTTITDDMEIKVIEITSKG